MGKPDGRMSGANESNSTCAELARQPFEEYEIERERSIGINPYESDDR